MKILTGFPYMLFSSKIFFKKTFGHSLLIQTTKMRLGWTLDDGSPVTTRSPSYDVGHHEATHYQAEKLAIFRESVKITPRKSNDQDITPRFLPSKLSSTSNRSFHVPSSVSKAVEVAVQNEVIPFQLWVLVCQALISISQHLTGQTRRNHE